MPWNHRNIKVPRSATRQNLLYNIETLARRVSQVECAQNPKNAGEVSAFFEDAYRELERLRDMAERDLKLRQVYIYQKLFDLSRDLFRYAPPTDIEYQFLFIQRSLDAEFGSLSDADKKSFEDLQEEVLQLQEADNDARLSVRSLGAISYFAKVSQDKQILTIWNSEKLITTSLRLGALLCVGIAASLVAAAALFNSQDRIGEFKYGLDALKLLGALAGGVTGGCVSAIATSRSSSDETVIPLISTDWMRPILGGVAGLVFGLTATAGVGEVKPAFVISGAIAFGFSEQLLYSWLKRRSEQLEKQLGSQVVQGNSKSRKGKS